MTHVFAGWVAFLGFVGTVWGMGEMNRKDVLRERDRGARRKTGARPARKTPSQRPQVSASALEAALEQADRNSARKRRRRPPSRPRRRR